MCPRQAYAHGYTVHEPTAGVCSWPLCRCAHGSRAGLLAGSGNACALTWSHYPPTDITGMPLDTRTRTHSHIHAQTRMQAHAHSITHMRAVTSRPSSPQPLTYQGQPYATTAPHPALLQPQPQLQQPFYPPQTLQQQQQEQQQRLDQGPWSPGWDEVCTVRTSVRLMWVHWCDWEGGTGVCVCIGSIPEDFCTLWTGL